MTRRLTLRQTSALAPTKTGSTVKRQPGAHASGQSDSASRSRNSTSYVPSKQGGSLRSQPTAMRNITAAATRVETAEGREARPAPVLTPKSYARGSHPTVQGSARTAAGSVEQGKKAKTGRSNPHRPPTMPGDASRFVPSGLVPFGDEGRPHPAASRSAAQRTYRNLRTFGDRPRRACAPRPASFSRRLDQETRNHVARVVRVAERRSGEAVGAQDRQQQLVAAHSRELQELPRAQGASRRAG